MMLVTDDGDVDAELWSRVGAAWSAWFTQMRAGLPEATESADHAQMLEAAGFTVVSDQELAAEIDPRRDESSRRFVIGQLVGTSKRLPTTSPPPMPPPSPDSLTTQPCSIPALSASGSLVASSSPTRFSDAHRRLIEYGAAGFRPPVLD